jgi:hypothetical protein
MTQSPETIQVREGTRPFEQHRERPSSQSYPSLGTIRECESSLLSILVDAHLIPHYAPKPNMPPGPYPRERFDR